MRGGCWVPPWAPCAPVTFPRPFPGGASRASRGRWEGRRAVTSSPPLGGSALLAHSRRRLGQPLRAPEREKDGGTESPRGTADPQAPLRSAAGPSRRGGRTLVLWAAHGASSRAAGWRRRLRAARRVCFLRASAFPELLVRPPSAFLTVPLPSHCQPSSLAWPLRALDAPGAMRRAAELGRTGQGARGARRGAGP